MGLWVYGFKGLWVEDLVVIVGMEVIERSREHRGFRRFEDSRVYGFMGLRVQGFKGLWVQGFMGLRVQGFMG
jgi:hypothetical protein